MTLELDAPLTFVSSPRPTAVASVGVVPRRVQRPALDIALVFGAWAMAVTAAWVFPLVDPQVTHVALFIHLMSMAVGFGAVILVDVYGILWLFGLRSLSELVALASVAHNVIALGVGGLLASGIALDPDLGSPLARTKMVLVLVLMLNGVAAQRMLHRMKKTLPPGTRGANIPWAGFQRVMAAAMISQSTWWGAIAIGFITNANRRS